MLLKDSRRRHRLTAADFHADRLFYLNDLNWGMSLYRLQKYEVL
jgi:hypothetical protein